MRRFRSLIVASLTLIGLSVVTPAQPAAGLSVSTTVTVGNSPVSVGFAPDGSRAYVSNSGTGTLSVVDTATGSVVATVNGVSGTHGIAVGPTRIVVNGTFTMTSFPVYVIDRSTGAILRTVNTLDNAAEGIAMNAAETFAYAVTGNSVTRIDLSNGAMLQSPTVAMAYSEIVLNSAGTRAYVTSYNAGTVTEFDTTSMTVLRTLAPGFGPIGIAVAPDGSHIIVASCSAASVLRIDLASFTTTATTAVASCPWGVAINPAGTRTYVTSYSGDKVTEIDQATATVLSETVVGSRPKGLRVSPDGTKLYVVNGAADSVSVIQLPAEPTAVSAFSVRVNKSKSATAIAMHANLAVKKGSRISLSVTKTSTRYCRVIGSTVKGIKAGTCRVRVVVTPKKGRAKSKTVTLEVKSRFAD